MRNRKRLNKAESAAPEQAGVGFVLGFRIYVVGGLRLTLNLKPEVLEFGLYGSGLRVEASGSQVPTAWIEAVLHPLAVYVVFHESHSSLLFNVKCLCLPYSPSEPFMVSVIV